MLKQRIHEGDHETGYQYVGNSCCIKSRYICETDTDVGFSSLTRVLRYPASACNSALIFMVAKFEKVSETAYGSIIRSP